MTRLTMPSESLERLRAVLQPLSSVLVAFSGGVDSSLLLNVAAETLGADNVQALTARSPLRPAAETERAYAFAKNLGVIHRQITSSELDLEAVAYNRTDRCYHCKKSLFLVALGIARQQGLATVCDGTNLDDLTAHRPGSRAIAELGVHSPLAEAGLNKADVRELCRQLQLNVWNLPADSCLATRFPYGTQLTPEGLHQVEEAEAWLHQQGMSPVRVRHHGDTARVEVSPAALPRIAALPLREALISRLKQIGFTYVCLDLEGYRSGSMDTHLHPITEEEKG